MRKERQAATGAGSTEAMRGNKLVRTTVFLTMVQNRCLDLVALRDNRPKGEILRELVEDGLRKKYDIDPRGGGRITLDIMPERHSA